MIGTYYRLSLADEDVGADKAESNSIQGQRGLVEGYIMARPELATEPRQEYVDDGYSGTNKPPGVPAADSGRAGWQGENNYRKGLFPVCPRLYRSRRLYGAHFSIDGRSIHLCQRWV